MPQLGLGTWQADPGVVGNAVRYALSEAQYTHLDCAAIYGNEKEIGESLHQIFSDSPTRRESVFITSKLWNTQHHPHMVAQACRQTLSDLQLDYLDLYLMHWGVAFDPTKGTDRPLDPQGRALTDYIPLADTWSAMEKLVTEGLVRSIGVANFPAMLLLDLLSHASISPEVNQIELHPYLAQKELLTFCNEHDVAVTAYSPLGAPGGAGKQFESILLDPTILQLSRKYQKSAAQIVLRWGIQRGTAVIPKSVTPERITENSKVFDFELSLADMETISKLDRNQRIVDPVRMWGLPYFS